jgi:CheY-like chemotaxis protein
VFFAFNNLHEAQNGTKRALNRVCKRKRPPQKQVNKKGRHMTTAHPNSQDFALISPLILLSGDNARTAALLQHSLTEQGFQVQLAPGYHELETLWQQQRHPMVLLEVSGPQSVEAAVTTALSLKRRDPQQFVGYLADPGLHTSGLAGDAIFPRTPDQLAGALRHHFSKEI